MGMNFMTSKALSKTEFEFNKLKGAISFMLIFYLIFLTIMAVLGMMIAKQRNCKPISIILFGLFIFFFASVPLFAEGTGILEFSNMDDQEFRSMCDMNIDEID